MIIHKQQGQKLEIKYRRVCAVKGKKDEEIDRGQQRHVWDTWGTTCTHAANQRREYDSL